MTAPTTPPTVADLLEHAGFVRYLARALVVGEAEADDLFQDAYLTALRSPPKRSTNLRGWLATVVRNLARMRRRTDRRRTARETASARADGAPGADETAARLEIQRLLVDAVASLDEPFRTTVVLRYFDGLRPAEIARRQGVPAKTVHSRLSRALARLRGRLDREHAGSRSAWRASLLPLAGLAVSGTARGGTGAAAAATLTGGMLMGAKVKVGLVAAAVIVAGIAVWQSVVPQDRPAPDLEEVAGTPLPPVPTALRDPAEGSPPLRPAGADADGGTESVAAPAEPPAPEEDRQTWRIDAVVVDHLGAPAPGARLTFSNERSVARKIELRRSLIVRGKGRAARDPGIGGIDDIRVRSERAIAALKKSLARVEGVADGNGRCPMDVPVAGILTAEYRDTAGSEVVSAPPWEGVRVVTVKLRVPDPFGPQAEIRTFNAGAGGAYGGRGGHRNLKSNGGGKDTEDAVDAGLAWLKRNQLSDGSWAADPGVTGLALLAFLGAGETHRHGAHKETVEKGLARLLAIQDGSGGFGAGGPRERVNHGIATQAVAEAWALTGAKKLGAAARRALEFQAATAPSGDYNGEETVWAACAMISARAGKLEVAGSAIEWAKRRLAEELKAADRRDAVVIGGAVFCLRRLEPAYARGSDGKRHLKTLLGSVPRWGGAGERADFPAWHFATLALHQEGGKYWEKWNKHLRETLTTHQIGEGAEKGSWDPVGPDSEALGRAGVTALAVATLEVYYRFAR